MRIDFTDKFQFESLSIQSLELLGPGRRRWLAHHLKSALDRNSDLAAALVMRKSEPWSVLGLAQHQFPLAQVLFVETDGTSQHASEVIRPQQTPSLVLDQFRELFLSRAFRWVVFDREILGRRDQDITLKRIRFWAKKSNSLWIMESSSPTPFFMVQGRLDVGIDLKPRVLKWKAYGQRHHALDCS